MVNISKYASYLERCSLQYRNKEFKGCRKISNLNLGPLTHEVSELKKAGYEKKYFKDFEVLMIEK